LQSTVLSIASLRITPRKAICTVTITIARVTRSCGDRRTMTTTSNVRSGDGHCQNRVSDQLGDRSRARGSPLRSAPGRADMIVVVLAILGVPLWLVLGAIAAGLWSRRSFRRAPGVFAIKARPHQPDRPQKWPRRATYARWVHDVLIVHQGVGLVRNHALPVAESTVLTVSPTDVSGLGADPIARLLQLDDGTRLEVAASSRDEQALGGPFEPAPDTAGATPIDK
jgi:hypothetical protein